MGCQAISLSRSYPPQRTVNFGWQSVFCRPPFGKKGIQCISEHLLLVIFIISSLSYKTDLISNFRIADLPGITDTDIPGNSAMTGKAKTAKHRREKEVKYRFYFNIPQRMFIVEATAVTASLPLQKRKVLCTLFGACRSFVMIIF